MHQAAVAADIDPDRLSFTTALRAVRRFITSAATATSHLLAGLVERSQSPYPSKKHATQPVSTTVAYTIEVHDPG